jgi:adenine-specific DNA-methyltransferase
MKTIGGCDPAVAIRNISARIRGYEIDPFAAWMGQVFIEATVLPTMALADRRPECITVCDSLTTGTKTRFDLVIGNPPFGRVSLPAKQRDRFARSLYGHANLYGLFTDLAVELASPKGLISLLTPSSFLAGEYFKNLRAVLSREAPPAAIDFVTARRGVFEDVLQETVLATYRKGTRRKGQRRASAAVSFIQPQPGSPAALLARSPRGALRCPATSAILGSSRGMPMKRRSPSAFDPCRSVWKTGGTRSAQVRSYGIAINPSFAKNRERDRYR